MRSGIARRRSLQHGTKSGQDKDILCRVCHREDATARHQLVGGLCGACYSWWRNVSLYSGKELGSYLENLQLRTERFGVRANLLANHSPILPEIKHKTQ